MNQRVNLVFHPGSSSRLQKHLVPQSTLELLNIGHKKPCNCLMSPTRSIAEPLLLSVISTKSQSTSGVPWLASWLLCCRSLQRGPCCWPVHEQYRKLPPSIHYLVPCFVCWCSMGYSVCTYPVPMVFMVAFVALCLLLHAWPRAADSNSNDAIIILL